jgi:hypothetical protein
MFGQPGPIEKGTKRNCIIDHGWGKGKGEQRITRGRRDEMKEGRKERVETMES